MNYLYKFNSSSIIVLCVFLLALSGCNQSDKVNDTQKTILMAHAMNPTHPVAKSIDYLGERVAKHSNGKLTLEIYPGQQLGSERELLELVQIGSIGMTKVSGAALENTVPSIQVFGIPYLFRNDEHMNKVFNGKIGKELLEEGAKYGLKGIAYYDAGKRSFYTINTPVRKPEDLDGLKIRVQNSVMAIRLVNQLGGSPTPLAFGELYTALQGGVVDGAENNPPSFYTTRHYEVCDYYILDEHTAVPDLLVISTQIWNDLTDQEKEWLQKAVNESVEYQSKLWRESVEESMNAVKKAGVEIIRPDKEPFIKAVQPIYEQIKKNKPELYEWVERIQQVN